MTAPCSPGCLLRARHVMELLINSLHIENQACPTALSQMGKIRLGAKSHLVGCLEKLTTVRENAAASPPVEVPPKGTALTRKKRGKGIRRRVEPSSSIPGNWQAFLRIDENKVELFAFPATTIATAETEKQIISPNHKHVLCTQPRDVTGLAPCSHEEADTRILLHVQDAVIQGYTKVSIRTVDTDVVVLAVAVAEHLVIEELWVAFGTAKTSGTWQLTRWLWHWDRTSAEGCHSSTH
ncbi:hypothetical protein Pmani_003942 [Petrolisthes manimaculis]|uniref:Uncharacterized protein n=1 Tax=Petrolisthes manimaculis TaxID=1843537 RepID=A0AAE1QHM0_9EUCA|nr:hypothetical protein Pmani_003942 [Petrolisthes manimaculis]